MVLRRKPTAWHSPVAGPRRVLPRNILYKIPLMRYRIKQNPCTSFQQVEKGHLPGHLHHFSSRHYCFNNPDPVQGRQCYGWCRNSEGKSRCSLLSLFLRRFGRHDVEKEADSDTSVHSST
jgi:hypothetical protein